MNKLSVHSSTVHLSQQGTTCPSSPFNLEVQASLYQRRSYTVTPKNPAFVLGEQVLRPAIDNGYYYSCQLVSGVRSVFSYIDASLSKLFSIFPGVSAEPVEPDEREIAVLAKSGQNLETARIEKAFIAYVTSWMPDMPGIVSAIDTYSNKIVANVTVGRAPTGIAITPNSRYAYVANYYDNTVSVIDTYSNKVFASFAVGTNPLAVAITPDGQYAYVVNYGFKGSISVIETSINRVKTTVSGFRDPSAVVITPNGLYAYVADFEDNNNTVSVIETANNTVLTTIGGLHGAGEGIAITPDGLYAYVTNRDSNIISVIDTSSNTVKSEVTLIANSNEVAITPNGLYAYVTCFYNKSVSVIETTNNAVLTTIGVGNGPLGIAITPDGLYAYVANRDSNTVSVINTISNAVIATITLPFSISPLGIAITPAKIPTSRKGLNERKVKLLETINKR